MHQAGLSVNNRMSAEMDFMLNHGAQEDHTGNQSRVVPLVIISQLCNVGKLGGYKEMPGSKEPLALACRGAEGARGANQSLEWPVCPFNRGTSFLVLSATSTPKHTVPDQLVGAGWV